MPTRTHKARKKRGDRTMGYGRVGQHRKHPSGRGMSGSKRHLETWINRFHPGYFGKLGMRKYHLLRNRIWEPAINVSEIWRLVPESVKNQVLGQKEKAPVVDVLQHGYAKVIGKGRVPQQPIIVKARSFSHRAEEKIKQAGGRCLIRA
jgi:ribosomal protein L15